MVYYYHYYYDLHKIKIKIYFKKNRQLRKIPCSFAQHEISYSFLYIRCPVTPVHLQTGSSIVSLNCSHYNIICLIVRIALLQNSQWGATSSTSSFIRYPRVNKVCPIHTLFYHHFISKCAPCRLLITLEESPKMIKLFFVFSNNISRAL